MTEQTIHNTTDHAAHFGAGDDGPGRVAIPAKGRTIVAPSPTYDAYAVMTLESRETYRSNTVFLDNGSQTLTASVQSDNGVFILRIIATPGPFPNEIVLVNHCPEPVTFFISPASAPSVA